MTAEQLRRIRLFAAGCVVVLPALSLHEVSAQTTASALERLREAQRAEAAQVANIDAEIEANGPFSPRLFDMYYALAMHHRDGGDYELALDLLEDALHIQRVTHGLFSLEQLAVTRELLQTSLIAGDFDRAASLEAQLMRIAYENPTDTRTATILSDVADRQLDVYERYLAGELPPQVSINFNSPPNARFRAGTGQLLELPNAFMDENRYIGLSNLMAARNNYRGAIGVLVAAGAETDSRIVEYERRLIESYFMQSRSERFRPEFGDSLFRRGANSYARILQFAAQADDLNVAAEALVGLADWHMLFQRFGTGLRMYAEAYAQLDRLGASDALLASLFSPDVPISLPTFEPNPLSTAHVRSQSANPEFVDVRMRLSRYGRSRARFIETEAAASDAQVVQRIRRAITRNRFRPILDDGTPQQAAEVAFRYYYDSDQI